MENLDYIIRTPRGVALAPSSDLLIGLWDIGSLPRKVFLRSFLLVFLEGGLVHWISFGVEKAGGVYGAGDG